jgi:methyl-accepting chemotaxis protein
VSVIKTVRGLPLAAKTRSMTLQAANQRTDNSEQSTRKLSDDIGKMADRIGDMADRIGNMAERIGVMADRILETQRIESKNLEKTQDSIRELVGMMSEQAKASNRIIELLAKKELDIDPTD